MKYVEKIISPELLMEKATVQILDGVVFVHS